MQVIQDTGYLNGTYSPEELIYENVKEKDAKIAFLQKLIDAVSMYQHCLTLEFHRYNIHQAHSIAETTSAEGATLKARPSRIVAGHEPERTNELLQAIGIALDSNAGTASKPAAGPLKKRAPAAVADKVASKKTESNDAAKVRKPMAGSTTKPTRGDTETKRKPTDEKVSKKPIALKPSKTVTPMKVAKDDVIDKKSNKNADRNSEASSKKQARSEKTLDESGERQRKRTNTFIASDAKEVESNVGGEALADVEPIEPNSEIEVEVVQNDGASQVNEEVTQSSNFIEPAIIPMELENSSPSEEQQRSEIPIESVACDSISVAKLRKSSSKQRAAENPLAPIKIAESLDSSGKLLTLEAPQTANEKQIEIAESKLNVSPLDISNTQHVESKAEILNDSSASAVVSEVASMRKSSSKKQPADKPVNPSPSPTQSTQLAAPSVDKPTANAKPAATPAVPPPFPMLPSSRPRTSLRPASVRPASARPGAPRRRERNVQVYLPPDEATLAAAASTKLNAASGDAFGLDLDADDDQLIVVEDASMMGVGGHTADNAAGQTTAIGIGFSNGIDDTDGQQHGHLVQQILQTQKNFNENDNEQVDLCSSFSISPHNSQSRRCPIRQPGFCRQQSSVVRQTDGHAARFNPTDDAFRQSARQADGFPAGGRRCHADGAVGVAPKLCNGTHGNGARTKVIHT